jgi:iron complex transport system substrate-binding protein
VAVPPRPARVVSLVPSITELLFALGLEDRIAGVTIF